MAPANMVRPGGKLGVANSRSSGDVLMKVESYTNSETASISSSNSTAQASRTSSEAGVLVGSGIGLLKTSTVLTDST